MEMVVATEEAELVGLVRVAARLVVKRVAVAMAKAAWVVASMAEGEAGAMVAARVGTCSALRNHRSQSHTRTVPPPHAPRSANPQRRPGRCCCTIACMYLSTTRAAEEWLVVALAAVKEVAREDTYSADHSQCSLYQDSIALERCRGR